MKVEPMYFNTYLTSPDTGLRESINAMLEHVAYNGRDFGYLPSVLHEANHNSLLEEFDTLIEPSANTLKLVPRVSDSAGLSDLCDTLIFLCNVYPVHDSEECHRIEYARIIAAINDVRADDEPDADLIERALFELGAEIEQSEYGANFSSDDYAAAVNYARENFS